MEEEAGGHTPLKNAHSSQTTPEGRVHRPCSPRSVRTISNLPPAWVQAAEAGLAMANSRLSSVNKVWLSGLVSRGQALAFPIHIVAAVHAIEHACEHKHQVG